MLKLNSKTLLLNYGRSTKMIKLGSTFESIEKTLKDATDLLTAMQSPENLEILDTDIASPYSIKLFVDLKKKELDQLQLQLNQLLDSIKPEQEKIQFELKNLFTEIDTFIRDAYMYEGLKSDDTSLDIFDADIPVEKTFTF